MTKLENTRQHDLGEKVAVVTGGTRGIGRAIAEELSSRGARVAVIGRDAATAAAVASDLPGEAIGVAVDLSHPDGPAAMVHEVALELGPIQLLVNNAGIGMGKPSLEVERGEWQTLLDVNLTAVFFCSTAVAAAMPPEGGAIVNISSVAGLAGIPERAAYCATKAAVVGLTRELAVEWAPTIRVNCLAPGYVRTDLADAMIKAGRVDPSAVESRSPAGRYADPAEMARVAAFLLSDDASFINGQTVVADGGWLANGAP